MAKILSLSPRDKHDDSVGVSARKRVAARILQALRWPNKSHRRYHGEKRVSYLSHAAGRWIWIISMAPRDGARATAARCCLR